MYLQLTILLSYATNSTVLPLVADHFFRASNKTADSTESAQVTATFLVLKSALTSVTPA